MTQKALLFSAMSIGRAASLIAAMALMLAIPMAGSARADFGILPGSFTATATDDDGDLLTQAGARANATTGFRFNTAPYPGGGIATDEDIKDIQVELPPGVVADPQATPQCLPADFTSDGCPANTQVGTSDLLMTVNAGSSPTLSTQAVYNLAPADGQVAQFGFKFEQNFVLITPRVRSESDFGVTATISNVPGGVLLFGSSLTLWGVPAAPVHDPQRFFLGGGPGAPAGIIPEPFFSNPTRCGSTQPTRISVRSWQHPERWVSAEAPSPDVTGCDKLQFAPSMTATPSTSLPDAPSGLDVVLRFPQNTVPAANSTPALRTAKVTLPEGMTINPGSADGLGACPDSLLKLNSTEPTTCPDASKIGTVEATSPVLDEKLAGAVYLRTQNSDDPESGEMFRMALVLENKARGLSIRLPGQIKVNKDTGRIVTEFQDNPQLPVSEIKLALKTGPRAPLVTPPTCGDKSIDAHLAAWSAQTADLGSSSIIDCAADLGGFAPTLTAGAASPTAGTFSPFGLTITKPDGNQPLTSVSMALPTGLLAQLKGNIGSQVGTVRAFAGPGSNPFMLPGKVFLEGPYGDAPFSLRVVVPAKAGPFDLGDVVVRQKIYVDPITAQVTVVSDPLPTIVKGVPVRLQRLDVNVDKPGFIINPTSCAAKSITGTLGAVDGQSATINVRFQVGDCASLALKPSLGLTLSGKGQTRDGGHPAVSATLTQPVGQSNLKKVRVALPLSLALDPDNAASDGLCSFAEGSKPDPKCPASSVVGRATAVTPILDQPLSGPVYFVKNERKDPKSGRSIKTTPKLVIPLVGENGLKLTLTGASTVVDDQLVTTFDNIPDAPVSSFKLDINGGKKGILVVSGTDICKATQVADQQIDGQNNKAADTVVAIQTPSCPLKLLSTKVGTRSVVLKVGGLSAGKVTVTGRGIKKTTKTIAKSTVATITAQRTKGKPGKLTVSFDPAGPAKAHKIIK
jgi:hypothetical protein